MRLSIPKFWRAKDIHYAITLTECSKCGSTYWGKWFKCPKCGSPEVSHRKSVGEGTIVEYTTSYFRVFHESEYLPKHIALIRLKEGALILGEVVDVKEGELKEGMEVEAVLRRYGSDDPHGLIYYGLKFIPKIRR